MKSPCDWADSVMLSQKDACDKKVLSGEQCKMYEFASDADYYRIPWYDWPSNKNSTQQQETANIIKSKPYQDSKYDDIFDTRQRKLLLFKQIMETVPRHVKIVRLSEFQLNPDIFVKDLVKEYQFTLKKKYTPPPPIQNMLFTCMSYTKWIEAQQRIDWTLEGYFGHNHLDCHLCRGGVDDQSTNDEEEDDDFFSESDGAPSNIWGESTTTIPSNIYILGERNSGTTFVSNTLAEAFEVPNTMGSNLEKFSSDIPVLLHKHMFRHDLLTNKELAEIKAREDILWIMVVRSPCDWGEGMFRKPYHLCPPKSPEKCGPSSDPNDKIWLNQNSVAGKSLLEFWTEMKWNDWAESVPFLRDNGENEWKKKKGKKNVETKEISISKVSSNYTYPNVFSLRRHKLEIMEQIVEVMPRNVKLVRLNELERSPELFIQCLVKEFSLTVKDGYTPQPKSAVAHGTTCLTKEEWDAAQQSIDWNMEADFGYGPSECRLCYGYDRSTRLYTRVMNGKKNKKLINEQAGKGKQGNKRGKAATKALAQKENEEVVNGEEADSDSERSEAVIPQKIESDLNDAIVAADREVEEDSVDDSDTTDESEEGPRIWHVMWGVPNESIDRKAYGGKIRTFEPDSFTGCCDKMIELSLKSYIANLPSDYQIYFWNIGGGSNWSTRYLEHIDLHNSNKVRPMLFDIEKEVGDDKVLSAAYASLPEVVPRGDLIRYIIMRNYGGSYVDIDGVLVKPLPYVGMPVINLSPAKTSADKPDHMTCTGEGFTQEPKTCILSNNLFIGYSKNHKLFQIILDTVKSNVDEKGILSCKLGRIFCLGPNFITSALSNSGIRNISDLGVLTGPYLRDGGTYKSNEYTFIAHIGLNKGDSKFVGDGFCDANKMVSELCQLYISTTE